MRRGRLRVLTLALVAAAAVPSSAEAANPFYALTVAGTQTVSWSFTGTVTRGGCSGPAGSFPIVTDDAGSGSMTFKIKNRGASFVSPTRVAGRLAMTFSANVKATGTMSGSYTVGASRLEGGPCDAFVPDPARTEPTTNCGAQSFGLRLDGQMQGAFLWVNAPEDIVAPASPRRGASDCPFPSAALPGSLSRDASPQNTSCDMVTSPLWKRSYELNSMGRGWASVKLPVTPARVLQPRGRTVVLARRVQKRCELGIDVAGGAKLLVNVSTQLTLTLRRRS